MKQLFQQRPTADGFIPRSISWIRR